MHIVVRTQAKYAVNRCTIDYKIVNLPSFCILDYWISGTLLVVSVIYNSADNDAVICLKYLMSFRKKGLACVKYRLIHNNCRSHGRSLRARVGQPRLHVFRILMPRMRIKLPVSFLLQSENFCIQW